MNDRPLSFYAHNDKGQADSAYSVVTYRPGRVMVLGSVVRYGKEWIACDTTGSWVATTNRRGTAAAALLPQEA